MTNDGSFPDFGAWLCPACDRRVPGRIRECRCGYVQDGGDATLALMGVKLMPLPEEPFIRFAGRLSDQERLQALEAAALGTTS